MPLEDELIYTGLGLVTIAWERFVAEGCEACSCSFGGLGEQVAEEGEGVPWSCEQPTSEPWRSQLRESNGR